MNESVGSAGLGSWSAYGVTLRADHTLSAAVVGQTPTPVTLTLRRGHLSSRDEVEAQVSWLEDVGGDRRTLTEGRLSDQAVLWYDEALFVIASDGCSAQYWTGPSVSSEGLEHLMLDVVVPVMLTCHSAAVLHAGAVLRPAGDALLVCGDSGWGKSTLTAALALQGCPALGDDTARITGAEDDFVVHPSYPSLRLHEDARALLLPAISCGVAVAPWTTKRRYGTAQAGLPTIDVPAPLGPIVVLNDPANAAVDIVSVERLNLDEALNSVFRHRFSLRMWAEQDKRKTAERLLELVARGVFRISYPRTGLVLGEVAELLCGLGTPDAAAAAIRRR